MRTALVVNKVGPDHQKNLDAILGLTEKAAMSGAELVLFPEAALSGLINNDNPEHDLPLGQTIPGPATSALATLCDKHDLWLGIGLLERDGHRLYDSAVLIDGTGRVALKYRRNQPQWHGRKANPSVYCEGSEIGRACTPFGSLAFLLCGDLFDDNIVARVEKLKPDFLLFPFARCFSDGSFDQHRWDTDEIPEYAARVKLVGAPTLMVNYVADADLPDDNSFGGAFVISAQGKVIASKPLGKQGILMVDMEKASNNRVEATR